MVKAGYKQSEVGEIPEDWDADPLNKLTSSISSGTSSTRSKIGEYPIFGSTGMIGSQAYFDYEGPKILVARVGANAGTVNKVDGRYCVSDNTLIVDFKANYELKFFYYQLVIKQLNNLVFGSGQPLITGGQLKALQFPVPSNRNEQKAIADALSDVDALIGSLEKLIAKKRDIKTGTMQQLLTGKKRLPGFEGKWVNSRLGKIGQFSKGKGIKKDDVLDSGLPCIRYGEIYTRHHDYIKKFYSYISPAIASEATSISAGDLLFAGSGETSEEIGKCVAYLFDEQAFAGGDIVIYRAPHHDAKYLGFLMNHESVVAQKMQMGQGDAVVHIHAKNLAGIEVCLPPVDEQQAISAVLSDMDIEIGELENRLAKTKAIKQGMMQELLTGRTRLV